MTSLDTIDEMLAELKAADPIFLPSGLWQDLNSKNNRMLQAEGLANFKRTVAQNYFNWFIADTKHPLFEHAFKQWRNQPNLLPLLTRLPETDRLRFTTNERPAVIAWKQRQLYKFYVCFIWTIMVKHDRHNLRHRVEEPEIGNPFRVKYGRRLLSQDLATSIIECNVLADLPRLPKPRVAEVGAGYGRLAYTYVNTLPGQYFIFDIPPALAVAQWYLEQTLGTQRVFRFRHFDRLEEVSKEMDQASVVLLTPNQIPKFPDQYFDICLTISTLPELTQDQIDFYLSEFQRLSRGHIFIKQYKSWKNPVDGTDLTADSYRLHPDWHVALERTDPVIPSFFNRVWSKLPSDVAPFELTPR